MGYPLEDLVKLEFGGALAGETWETGCWFFITSAPLVSPAMMDAALTACDTEIGGLWTDFLKGWNASGLTLSRTKLSFYDNGVLSVTAEHAITVAAATGTAPQPGYVSQCIGLYTALSRRYARGRMYLPRTGNAPTASTFQWTTIATALGQLKTRLHNIETALQTNLTGASAANLRVVSQTGPGSQQVTQLKADSIPDTQHGRTRRLLPLVKDSVSY